MLERQGRRSLPRKAAGRNSWPKTAVTFAACTTTGWEGLPEAPGAQVILPRARHAHKRLNPLGFGIALLQVLLCFVFALALLLLPFWMGMFVLRLC